MGAPTSPRMSLSGFSLRRSGDFLAVGCWGCRVRVGRAAEGVARGPRAAASATGPPDGVTVASASRTQLRAPVVPCMLSRSGQPREGPVVPGARVGSHHSMDPTPQHHQVALVTTKCRWSGPDNSATWSGLAQDARCAKGAWQGLVHACQPYRAISEASGSPPETPNDHFCHFLSLSPDCCFLMGLCLLVFLPLRGSALHPLSLPGGSPPGLLGAAALLPQEKLVATLATCPQGSASPDSSLCLWDRR